MNSKMNYQAFVIEKVNYHFCEKDDNCAVTTLNILSEYFDMPLDRQVIESALGLGGGLGNYGAQCGLVTGAVMFLGILEKKYNYETDIIVESARKFAVAFENKFGSLQCRTLRPEGFKPENPPNICKNLAEKAIGFDIEFIEDHIKNNPPKKAGTPQNE